jgi:hypothetical protein
MLKAKLVVKQGQKVMGLYAKDRQTAQLKRYLFSIHRSVILSSSLLGF